MTGGAGQAQTGQDGAKPCKAGQKQVGHARQSQNTANIPNAWEKIGGDSSQSSRAATFMGFRELKEEEERHCILEEGIPQQLEAFIAVVLLACLGSQRLQHIHYVGQPAAA